MTRDRLALPVLILIFGGSLVAALIAGSYWLTVVTELAIFSIFALSIDFLVGYTGLVTFGQAGFMGVGAYTTAYCSQFLGLPVGASILLAVLAGAVAGMLVGALLTRVSGVFYIMVTLAFGMMFWAWASKARLFGADDGLGGIKRLDLTGIGVNLNDPRVFAIACIAVCIVIFLILQWLVRTPFGQILRAIKQNENRIRAQGCAVQRYKVAAFAVAAAVAALAGALHLQNTQFLHPEVAHWIKSGEGLIVVIVGGAGTLVGPIIGTYLFLIVHRVVESFTNHWQIVVGVMFIALVLAAPNGIYGRLHSLLDARRARATSASPERPDA